MNSANIKYSKRPIVIIDGFNIFLRNFMVNETVNSRSEPVGGVVGFLKFIDFVVDRFAPGKLIVVWESGGPSPRRKNISSAYKQNRAKSKEFRLVKTGMAGTGSIKDILRTDNQTKVEQLTLLTKLLKRTPVCQIFIKDTEGDDIIGYLAKYKFVKEDRMKIIASSDKDFYQLLTDPNVKIYDPARKITIDENFVYEKYGIAIQNFCLARTLEGDASDNIEGVPGVGLKTLCKRFPAFSDKNTDLTIDDVVNASKSLLEAKATKKLQAPKHIIECEKQIRTNWKLMYLNSSNLAATQIDKIQSTVDNHEPCADKVGFLKEISKAGMNIAFDFEKMFSNFRQFLIYD
jgi:DNA polymerase-1